MNEYVIINTNIESYDRFILCLTSESVFTYIKKIEDTLAKADATEKILFDMLLLTGNSINRFICCDFSKGKLNFNIAHIVQPDSYFRKETVNWLHNNYYYYVENSILTEKRRQKIKDGIQF